MHRVTFLLCFLVTFTGTKSYSQYTWDDRFFTEGLTWSGDLHVSQNRLFGSGFGFINGHPMQPAAELVNGKWGQLSNGGSEMYILSMAVHQGTVYATARTSFGQGVKSYLLRFDGGQNWTPLADAGEEYLYAYSSAEQLYLHGSFDTLAGKPARFLARWEGDSVRPLDHGVQFTNLEAWERGISGLLAHDQWVYAIGVFDSVGGALCRGIYRFHSISDSVDLLGTGADDIRDLAWWNNELYICGQFAEAGGKGAYRLARWNGVEWNPVGKPRDVVDLTQAKLDVFEGKLLVHSGIRSAGLLRNVSIASWNGTQWSNEYELPGLTIHSLVVYRGSLIASVDRMGSGKQLLQFADGEWTPLELPAVHRRGLGLLPNGYRSDVEIRSIVAHNDGVYILGDFLTYDADGDTIRNFARFDGENWHGLGDTLLNLASGLYSNGDRLFAAINSTLFELRDTGLNIVVRFNYDPITDVCFTGKKIAISTASRYSDHEPTESPMVYEATLETLEFEPLEVFRNVERIRVRDGRYYFMGYRGIGYYLHSRYNHLFSVPEGNGRLQDMEWAGDRLLLAGDYYGPWDGFLIQFRTETDFQFITNPRGYRYSDARDILSFENRTFIAGSLGEWDSGRVELGIYDNGRFTPIYDLHGSLRGMAVYDGYLYVTGTTHAKDIQSSGIARVKIGASSVKRAKAPLDERVQVYPNPASNSITASSGIESIYDQLGRKIAFYPERPTQIDVSRLSVGAYYLQLANSSMCRVSIIR